MSIQDLKMTYTALVKLQYNSKWESTGGIYDDEMLPEENITFEVPAEDLNTVQLFGLFNKFLYAMGHTESGIMKGAMSTTFNDMRSFEQMKKTADEYDLVMKEDHIKEVCKLEAEIRDLKAKLSRALDPENPNYTDDEIEAMTEEIIAETFQPTIKTLKDAEVVCKDCGSKYGTYSVGCSSTWMGKCNVCGKDKPVTEVRDWGYLAKGIGELKK